ncbi:MAG TPA: 4-alpha-glucanotransferase [Candidatus Acidoferrales bacterium]|nr:4-alpha-glucanotransferase [Candidatus Acidoferrales bacterium]
MSRALDRLAAIAGIEPSFVDYWGRETVVSDETKRALLAAMGFDAGDAADLQPYAEAERPPQERLECYVPPAMETGRIWMLATQLYGLRSQSNWGIGDFQDLRALAPIAHRAGAGGIGVNPLHALHPSNPRASSPYAPSSRLFLNALYIDPTAIPEFSAGDAPSATELDALRAEPLVDYEGVARVKWRAFQHLHRSFRRDHLDAGTARGGAFRAFVREQGEPLQLLARYEAMAEHFRSLDGFYGWQQWPAEYRSPESTAVAAFAAERPDQVEFFAYVQWLAHEQLAAAAQACAPMACGIYRDLAVGVELNGADAWADQRTIVAGASLGAPPDPLNALGQNWGLPPMSPHALREQDYEPFARLLHANMRYAGALRIDHVMALRRCFWIPRGASPLEGAYVRYPLEDLLAVVAATSARHRCVVVGEDLGTVPEGFRDRLRDARILSSRLVYFERDAAGAFLPPSSYPRGAASSVGTHDLPPLGGWWVGDDLAVRGTLALYPGEQTQREAGEDRWAARFALIDALLAAGTIDEAAAERLREDARHSGSRGCLNELTTAVHRFLAETRSVAAVVQLEDVLSEIDAVNVPGTVNEHPNWCRKRTVSVDDLEGDARLQLTGTFFAEVVA